MRHAVMRRDVRCPAVRAVHRESKPKHDVTRIFEALGLFWVQPVWWTMAFLWPFVTYFVPFRCGTP